MLRKQTVWLLTMLSLMIVLSVYYLNAPNEGDLAYNIEDQSEDQTTSLDQVSNETESGTEGANVTEQSSEELDTSSISTDEYFAAVRMEITNQRSYEKERLEDIVASSEATSEEKNEAYEAMKEIETLDMKESTLEEELKSAKGYEEVLVRNMEDNNLVVTVQADSLSAADANDIIQQAKEEFGEIKIDVVYQAQ
ncbi:SpoIIIAH-like family protein [Gracilibacillus caseinilyticus]|uniref:SpoIIIAH-like family protein n=1 Tax=Gracilibacillus caseinilyticus TaxID=2932256 RepID=A0ABY4ESS9_9BACI|nr:SpoIIIAH-like family protein [Gracilibacillus caseinilyticus]UOQ47482.1 SpoIIIAH-like family protein [Gracilibacillus caseinilyticus]